jgi:hypothetical protein
MNLEGFPESIKKDIEDQSLSILEHIKDDIIVIGGWAVRALTEDKHGRYTLDIDGVTDKEGMHTVELKLSKLGMNIRRNEWGVQYYCKYHPQFPVPKDIRMNVDQLELRIEILYPKIKESHTHHFFEFSLSEFEKREIQYHLKDKSIIIKTPPVEHIAAVKLGLPVDYKNNFDAQVLLALCDVEKVIEVIQKNDDWTEMVLRRIQKLIGRLQNPNRLEHILAINSGLNIKDHVKKLQYIKRRLNS